MDTTAKAGLDTLKTASKKVAHWAAETTDEFTRNKIADKIVKPKPASNENLRDIGETNRNRNIKWIKTKIIKMEHRDISKLLNNTNVSKSYKKMDWSEWFIRGSIFCQQEYKVSNSYAKIRFVWL